MPASAHRLVRQLTFAALLPLAGVPGGCTWATELRSTMDPLDGVFHVQRSLALPRAAATQPQRYIRVKERRYLLPGGPHPSRNRAAIRRALGGDWVGARKLFAALLKPTDCRALNNLGLSESILGNNEAAVAHLSRARRLCPGLEQVRWNLRSVLTANSVRPRPYSLRNARRTPSRSQAVPRGDSGKPTREESR